MQTNRKKELQNKVTSGFLGFWIRNFRLSYLVTAVVLLLGILAVVRIPKESMPEVDLGMVTITTAYPWASPEDIDALITEKIYKSIKDLDGIDKITSTSSLGVSMLQISAKTGEDIKDLRNDISSKIDSVSLPADAREPNISLIETNANMTFSLYLYEKSNAANTEKLLSQAIVLREKLEKLPKIDEVSIAYNPATTGLGSSGDDSKYEIEILLNQGKLDAYGLTLSSVKNAISAYNTDMPIGNFSIDEKNYDYRISGKNLVATDFLKTPIALPKGGTITLADIATISRDYKAKKSSIVMVHNDNFVSHPAIGLALSKTDSASIFSAASEAKAEIENIFATEEFKNWGYFYTSDIADVITTDYIDLAKNFASTLALVFIVMLFFVGLVDSLFATLTLPLAFLGTFLMLYNIGFSMNIMTNFSLIIALGIAIDTIIVFVQAASAKIKIGYDPQTAIILAFKEYAMSIIVGTATTIMVFIPIMSLPGVMGRFLAFIPVTIFGVLFFGLLFALTINGALYKAFVRPKKTYIENPTALEYATPEQKELLILEREGKILKNNSESNLRERIISTMTQKYRDFMDRNIRKKSFRMMAIFLPIIFFFAGFKVLAPFINVEMMPADDNSELSYSIKWSEGTTTEAMSSKIGNIENFFKNFSEIKDVAMVTSGNKTDITINLTPKGEREKNGEKTAFEIDDILMASLKTLEAKGLEVSGGVVANGPPSSWDVGINLTAENTSDLQLLIATANDFEKFIEEMDETKNVTNSSASTPGQFVFSLKKDLLAMKNISPNLIYSAIAEQANGLKVGEIASLGKDIDVVIRSDNFVGDITPETIKNISLIVGNTTYKIGDFLDVKPQNAVASISRKNGSIEISLGADLVDGANSRIVSEKILDFAEKYEFKNGISYSSGGAQSENSDLIISMVTALVLALTGIFAVLTWQFQSYAKPAMVFYSVFMAIPFVFAGLLLTDSPFSLMFGIGFIALMGISVNHGIILLEGVDQNLDKGMDGFMALIESSASRLEPMLLTTLTTVLGMLPLAFTGAMWAGLSWTIVFGLMATTFIALFSLGPVYYELFIKEKTPWKWKNWMKNIFKKIFSKKPKITRRTEESEK